MSDPKRKSGPGETVLVGAGTVFLAVFLLIARLYFRMAGQGPESFQAFLFMSAGLLALAVVAVGLGWWGFSRRRRESRNRRRPLDMN
jgi:cbb3-type cytochrome oxidase subunit 3